MPVEADAEGSGLGFEAYAREQRYAFLADAARHAGISVIATGHHADDQAETVLLRMLRGTAPAGLAGIPATRELASGLRVVRPMLDCYRHDITAYVEAAGIAYRHDTSNDDTNHARNRVRHRVLPMLESEGGPSVRSHLAHLAEIARGESDFLDAAAAQLLEQCLDDEARLVRDRLLAAHPALQRRALVQFTRMLGTPSDFEHIEALRRFVATAYTGQGIDLGAGVVLRAGRDTLERSLPEPFTEAVRLVVPGQTAALGRVFDVDFPERSALGELRTYCTPTRQVFDADAIGDCLEVRFRRPGDRFAPFGLGGSKKLQDYFTDLKIPSTRRARIPLLLSGAEIAWVVGHAIGQAFAVSSTTQRVLEVRVQAFSSPA